MGRGRGRFVDAVGDGAGVLAGTSRKARSTAHLAQRTSMRGWERTALGTVVEYCEGLDSARPPRGSGMGRALARWNISVTFPRYCALYSNRRPEPYVDGGFVRWGASGVLYVMLCVMYVGMWVCVMGRGSRLWR